MQLYQLACQLLVQNLPHRQGDDDLAALAEEGVDFEQGVAGVIEGDEEALGAVLLHFGQRLLDCFQFGVGDAPDLRRHMIDFSLQSRHGVRIAL